MEMEIRAGGIVRRKIRVLHSVNVIGGFGYISPTQEIRIVVGPNLIGFDLFGVDVVGAALSDIKAVVAINSDMAFD